MSSEQPNQFAILLRGLDKYAQKDDGRFDMYTRIIYCAACDNVSIAKGDHPEKIKCRYCDTTKFNVAYPPSETDFEKLNPDIIIREIKQGVKKNFKSPTLYNSDLPAAVKAWEELDDNEKVKQIKEVEALVGLLMGFRDKVNGLERLLAMKV